MLSFILTIILLCGDGPALVYSFPTGANCEQEGWRVVSETVDTGVSPGLVATYYCTPTEK